MEVLFDFYAAPLTPVFASFLLAFVWILLGFASLLTGHGHASSNATTFVTDALGHWLVFFGVFVSALVAISRYFVADVVCPVVLRSIRRRESRHRWWIVTTLLIGSILLIVNNVRIVVANDYWQADLSRHLGSRWFLPVLIAACFYLGPVPSIIVGLFRYVMELRVISRRVEVVEDLSEEDPFHYFGLKRVSWAFTFISALVLIITAPAIVLQLRTQGGLSAGTLVMVLFVVTFYLFGVVTPLISLIRSLVELQALKIRDTQSSLAEVQRELDASHENTEGLLLKKTMLNDRLQLIKCQRTVPLGKSQAILAAISLVATVLMTILSILNVAERLLGNDDHQLPPATSHGTLPSSG